MQNWVREGSFEVYKYQARKHETEWNFSEKLFETSKLASRIRDFFNPTCKTCHQINSSRQKIIIFHNQKLKPGKTKTQKKNSCLEIEKPIIFKVFK